MNSMDISDIMDGSISIESLPNGYSSVNGHSNQTCSNDQNHAKSVTNGVIPNGNSVDERSDETTANLAAFSNGSLTASCAFVSHPNRKSSVIHASIPFPKMTGEFVTYSGRTTEGVIILTNFRVFLSYNSTRETGIPISLPLGAIELVEIRDLFYLYIYSKFVRSVICSFATSDECTIWQKRLCDTVLQQMKFDDLFCFTFYQKSKFSDEGTLANPVFESTNFIHDSWALMWKELKRMEFDCHKLWRISDINRDFKLCSSYPRFLIVPHNISDKDLESVANFRYSRRIPTAVWRHQKNGCIIARSSQPEVGWLGWRSNQDETLLQSMIDACSSNSKDYQLKKLLVLDARSYAAAVANRAKGGGCECPEYYTNCEVQFMCLANIHSIRKSYHSLRYICETPADQLK